MSSMMRGSVRMAVSGVRSAKWRSVLTMLGVIVGIVAVVTMVSIGEGVKRQVAGQLTHFGTNLITVRPGVASGEPSLTASNKDIIFGLGQISGLTTDDVTAVRRTSGVAMAAPLGSSSGLVQIDGSTKKAPIISTDSDMPAILNQKVHNGGFWSNAEESGNVAVLGRDAAADLFGESVPLGRSFTFRGQNFIVRGVLNPFKSVPFTPTANFDDAIFIPYQTAANLTHNNATTSVILAKADSQNTTGSVIGNIKNRIKGLHGGQQDFSVLSPKQVADNSATTVGLLSEWITAVAVISLIIGGVGIMNIMLLSVTERMHEIGVRKAVGATSRQILSQFIFEATVLSLVGGLIGIVLSVVADGLLYLYTDFKPVLSWRAMAVAGVVSLAIGVIFGTAPAFKAARKDPIEALRHE